MSDTPILFILGLFLLQMVIQAPIALIIRLGGFPEGIWRIMRVRYFVYWVIDAEGTKNRNVMRWTKIETHSPSYFIDHKGVRRFTDQANTQRSRGRSAWEYYGNNPFPVPVITGMRDFLNIDGEKINQAFRTDIIKRLYSVRAGEPSKTGSILKKIGIFVVVIIMGIAMAMLLRGMIH